jgi:hypothetical protein
LIYLLLVAVGKGVPQLYEILIESLISSAGLSLGPVSATHGYAPAKAPDSQPPEVLLDASEIGIGAVYQPTLCDGRDQHGLGGDCSSRQSDHGLGTEIMQVANEGLELGDYPQYVCVRDRAPDLSGPSRTADLPELRMRPCKRRDGRPAQPEPPVEREGAGIRHCHIISPGRPVKGGR